MKVAVSLLITAVLCLTMTVSMFGTSKKTSAELDREIRWELAHNPMR